MIRPSSRSRFGGRRGPWTTTNHHSPQQTAKCLRTRCRVLQNQSCPSLLLEKDTWYFYSRGVAQGEGEPGRRGRQAMPHHSCRKRGSFGDEGRPPCRCCHP